MEIELNEMINDEQKQELNENETNETNTLLNEKENEIYKNEEEKKLWRKRLLNIVYMGISFLIIFVSYNTTQNYMTSLYEKYGQISLFIVYFMFAFSGFFVPIIIRRIGEKWCLIIGGFCILPYIFVNIFKNEIVLIFSSFFVGFGQAISWCAEGSLLARSSHPEKRGRNSGIFFFVYQMNQTIGNGFAFILNLINIDVKYLFIIFTISCLIGIIPLFFINIKILPQIEKVPFKNDCKNILKLMTSKIMLLLIPIFLYSGLTQCYIFGEFTAMFGVGTTNMLISFFFGRLSDTIGRIPILLISSFFIIITCSMVVYYFSLSVEVLFVLFVAIISLGVSDAGFNTQIDTLIGRYFCNESDAAYAVFYSLQSLATAFGFPLFMGLQSLFEEDYLFRIIQGLVIIVFLIVALICLFILNKLHPIEVKK